VKKLKISVDQLMDLLTEMRETGGTETIYIFERDGLPAICDADDEDNYIIFSTGDDDGLH
jgi:hypothetical protein